MEQKLRQNRSRKNHWIIKQESNQIENRQSESTENHWITEENNKVDIENLQLLQNVECKKVYKK